jgi:hypothetical protein
LKTPTIAVVWFVACVAPLAAQGADPEALVQQLADAGTHDAARERLLAIGADAVPAIVGAFRKNYGERLDDLLGILTELGPAAGAALPQVEELIEQGGCDLAAVVALAEIVPWRLREPSLTLQYVRRQQASAGQKNRTGGEQPCEEWIADRRLWTRWHFPRDADLDVLLAIAQEGQALRREVAIECLGRRGPAASKAMPVLRRVLDEPEPRILTTDRTVPLHSKAARAVLAIEPNGELAATACAVLAGTRAAPAAKASGVPERLRARIDQLVAELAAPATRAAASANLVALGEAAAESVAAMLTSTDVDTLAVALATLCELGPRAAASVPRLVEASAAVPVEQRVTLLETLIAAAPWCADLVPPWLSGFERLPLGIDAETRNQLVAGGARLGATLCVDPRATLSELAAWLGDSSPHVRQCALAVVAARGAAARSLLPRLGQMQRELLPPLHEGRFIGNGVLLVDWDYTPVVQRLAARAIVAVAAAGDPVLTPARALLETEPPK